jgi:DNA-binding transcriptional LysR family regulator
VTLCRRTPQGIELTTAGKAVMLQSADMVEAVRLVPHLAAQAAKQIEGTLAIWMISDIISPELDEALASILRRHPDIELKIEVATWRTVLDGVSSGECDIGMTYESESLPQLRYEPMVHETQQLYCGRAHPLYGYRVRNPGTLSGERFILATADEPKDLERFRLHFGLGTNTAAHADDLHEAMRLISLGAGIGFLPTIVAAPLGDRLWPILPVSLLPSYFVYLIAPPPSRMSTPAQLFFTEMLRRLRAKPELA